MWFGEGTGGVGEAAASINAECCVGEGTGGVGEPAASINAECCVGEDSRFL